MLSKINSLEEYYTDYQKSVDDPEKFWEEKANKFVWKKKCDKILSWDFEKPDVRWFDGAQLNITEN